jgi:hemolysin III
MLKFITVDDERASSAVHLLAFLCAIGLVTFAQELGRGDAGRARQLAVFGLAMAAMYLASTLFHACPQGFIRDLLERVDRAAIFVFIAASYSFFAPVETDTLAVAIWGTAGVGAMMSLVAPFQRPVLVVLPYLSLGWLAVMGIALRVQAMGAWTLTLLLLGAAIYTLGVSFFVMARFRLAHATWHTFVVIGSFVHSAAAVL